MSVNLIVECLDCGYRTNYSPSVNACASCGSMWREARYDYNRLAVDIPRLLPFRPFNIWRYSELLPIQAPIMEVSLGEGGTPLIKANNLAMMLGCHNIFIKDERQCPTASFKDRQAAVTITALREAGISEMVVASTGNVAISYSAYGARAGIKVWAVLTSLVPAAKMHEVAIYGSQVIKVTGSYDQAKQFAAEFARQRGVYFDLGARSIPCVESMKTMAFEIAEQLPAGLGLIPSGLLTPQVMWRSPDWYIQSISGGMGPLGVMKGFKEMKTMGWVDHLPHMALIQAEGCSPMVRGWKENLETAPVVTQPSTIIETLATGDPGRTYTELRRRMLSEHGGVFESVTDEEAIRAMHLMAKMEGLSVEPAAAVAFAGLIKLVRAGIIKPHEVVVVNCTGHTMPIDENILGDGWAKDVVMPSRSQSQNKEEGLLAALSYVGAERFPRIAIVDDQPEVRQLVRRILQSQGEYQLFEACNGREAVELAVREHPNLIILDLMMPELDGFSVLDALTANPDTSDIPVIVITAKELTPAEKQRLKGRIQSLMQKGDFMSDELLEEVRALLHE